MDVSDDEGVLEGFHSIAEYVAADGLDDILHELRTVGFDAFPLFCRANAFIGDGFSAEIQKKLEEQMERLKEELSAGCQNVEMQIGGMGILNTFARLYLMEPKSIIFEISNKAEGGAEIVISAAMR